MLSGPPSFPKNWRKNGSSRASICGAAFTTLELEMLTTEGKTLFKTGAKLLLLGPSALSAILSVAGGLFTAFVVVCASPRPAAPRTTPKTRAAGFEKTTDPFSFMYPSLGKELHLTRAVSGGCVNFLTFTETLRVGLVILPTSRENRPR